MPSYPPNARLAIIATPPAEPAPMLGIAFDDRAPSADKAAAWRQAQLAKADEYRATLANRGAKSLRRYKPTRAPGDPANE